MTLLPLSGIRVLDFSQVMFGPLATQILADFGAEVIKIEKPASGDISRGIDPYAESVDDSSIFLSLNRNKRSVALDMKRDEAQAVLHRLLADTDVVVMNFKPGAAERLGIDYDSLAEKYPRLIFASGTGFGPEGPLSRLGGQDFAMQAASGAAWHNRSTDGTPRLYPVSFIDLTAGMALVQGVLLALLDRERSGQGQRVDVAMFDAAVFAQLQEYVQWNRRNAEIDWEKEHLIGSVQCADGWITIVGLFRENPLQSICAAFGMDDLSELPEFATAALQAQNGTDVWQRLGPVLADVAVADAVSALQRHNVLAGPVHDFDQALNHPQAAANGTFVTYEHPVAGRTLAVDNPIRLSRAADRPCEAPPLLGAHTEEVLRAAGFHDSEIHDLLDKSVCATRPEAGLVRTGEKQ